MAPIHKLQVETDIKSPAEKFYEKIKTNLSDFTKAFPEMYKHIEFLVGDGKTEGSIILFKYSTGNGGISVAKDRIMEINDKDRAITYDIFEGDLPNTYNTFVLKLQVIEKDDKSVVKWSTEYEKPNDVEDPNIFLGLLANAANAFDAYILKED
ncbi:hypothetical protein ACHQM5_009334 [Ranunculus cassubicifolius]